MVQAIITIGDKEDRVLNIVKGKFGLKNKSDAITHIINEYEENFLEPELRPEFIQNIKNIEKGKFHKYESIKALRDEIERV